MYLAWLYSYEQVDSVIRVSFSVISTSELNVDFSLALLRNSANSFSSGCVPVRNTDSHDAPIRPIYMKFPVWRDNLLYAALF